MTGDLEHLRGGAADGGFSQGQNLEWEEWGWVELPNRYQILYYCSGVQDLFTASEGFTVLLVTDR